MPVEQRASDIITKDTLLLGFSQVYFTPRVSGVLGTEVFLGILASQELAKEVETLDLERGDAGLITIDRSLVSRLAVSLAVETFSFKAALAQYIFASSTLVAVTADAAAAITNEQVTLPTTLPFDSFLSLARGDIAEASIEVTCATVTDEAVGTGDGSTNAFQLDQKVKAVGDVTSVTVGGVAYTPVAVGAAAAGNEVEVIVGETDGVAGTGSGSLEFFVGGVSTPPTNGAAIVATYTPSFSTTAGDIVNATAAPVEAGRSESIAAITFASPGGGNDTITRGAGSWITDGFEVGQYVTFIGTTSNDLLIGPILAVSATVLEVAESTVTPEGPVGGDALGFDIGGDFEVNRVNGSIRFINAGTSNSPFRPTGANQVLEVDYTYNRKASQTLKPFSQASGFEGKCVIKHLPDVGINFIWDVPSASIQITDDALTFDAEDFARGALTINILDAGGSDRFGTLAISSETEQLA